MYKNEQQIFNRVADHLFTQGKPSMNGMMCQYRGPKGTMCAIGCLIPDNKYNKNFDNMDVFSDTSVKTMRSKYKRIFNSFISSKISDEFLERLQYLHDNCQTTIKGAFNKKYLKKELSDIAKEYELTFSMPN